MTTQEEQIAVLTESLSSLENESRKLLQAVQWSSKVRKILFVLLLLFAAIAAFLFWRLYQDIKDQRIAKIQQIIAEQPEEFAQPLTRQIMSMAEQEGPFIAEVFRKQAEKDSKLYMNAIDKEQSTLVSNLQQQLEQQVLASYANMLEEQEAMLRQEFPVLKDPEKMKYLRQNMEDVYEKIGQRYYVDILKDELQSLTRKLEKFPPASPDSDTVPVGEQVASEFLELVQMMLVHSDHYVIPEEEAVPVRFRANELGGSDSDASANDAETNDDDAVATGDDAGSASEDEDK